MTVELIEGWVPSPQDRQTYFDL